MCRIASAFADVRVPDAWQGQWVVDQVLIDQSSDNGLPPQYNIPKYLGRIFNISASSLKINKPEDAVCKSPRFEQKKQLLSQLIADSIDSRAYSKNAVLIEDMQLNMDDKLIDVSYLSCDKQPRVNMYGMPPAHDQSNVVWFITLSEGQLALSWHDQTILILSPITAQQKPIASFDCKKAASVVEHALCRDLGLAFFDRSVADAYHALLTTYRAQKDSQQLTTQLKAAQRTWLKSRNKCKRDPLCLSASMDKRIDSLIYDLADIMYENR